MTWKNFLVQYKSCNTFEQQFSLLKYYQKNPVIMEQIKINFMEFWQNTKFKTATDYRQVLYLIGSYPHMYKILKEYLYLILTDASANSLGKLLEELIEMNVPILVDDNFEEFFNQYIKDYGSNNYYDYCEVLHLLNFGDREEKYTYLLMQKYLQYIFQNNNDSLLTRSWDIYQKMIDCFIIDLKYMAKKDKADACIHYIGGGSFAQVFKIGNYVLKIGYNKEYPLKQDSKYLIQCLFSREFAQDYFSIEVMPFVDTKGITEADVYEIYNNIREDNCLWCDPKKENMGVLLCDTTPLFPSLSKRAQSFLGVFDYRPQYKEQKVIIDLDYYFNFSEHNILEKQHLEQRYLEEYQASIQLYEHQYQKKKLKNLK